MGKGGSFVCFNDSYHGKCCDNCWATLPICLSFAWQQQQQKTKLNWTETCLFWKAFKTQQKITRASWILFCIKKAPTLTKKEKNPKMYRWPTNLNAHKMLGIKPKNWVYFSCCIVTMLQNKWASAMNLFRCCLSKVITKYDYHCLKALGSGKQPPQSFCACISFWKLLLASNTWSKQKKATKDNKSEEKHLHKTI